MKNKNPLISVVNATYNQAEWVAQLLISLKEQTYRPLEILIVGDGCTDNTREITEKFAKENNQADFTIRFIAKEHTGVQETRNRGLDEAKGKYIIFPDSDCFLYPLCLEKMCNVLEVVPSVGYVYCDMENLGFYNNIHRSGEFDEERLRRGNYIPVVALMRLIDQTPRWDQQIKRHQDYDIWLSWLDKGFSGYWINEVLFRHHTRNNSLTFTSVHIAEANASIWRKHGII